MKILAIGPHFAPDTAPTGVVLSRLVDEFAALGHQCDVVTALPWYRSHQVEPGWAGSYRRRENTSWGSITRLYPFPTDKGNLAARAAAFVGFTGLTLVDAIARAPRPDIVLAMSPPLTLAISGRLAAWRWRVPFVLNVQDIFPDVAVDVGAISNPAVVRLFERLERWSYKRADAVTVLSEDLRANVAAKLPGSSATITKTIPNFVDTSMIDGSASGDGYRRRFGIGDRFCVMYAGNVGHSQPLEMMIDAARALRHRDDIVFVINGDGAARPGLERAAAGLTNLLFVDFQPAEALAETLAAGDAHVVLLKAGLAKASVPSKLYSILAAARPVIAAVDAGTEVDHTITRAGAGAVVAPEDSGALVAAVEALAQSPDGGRSLGEAGRVFVESWPSPADAAHRYLELFRGLAERSGV